MEINEIKKIADSIEEKIGTNYEESNIFQTESGLELQRNLVDIATFLFLTNSTVYLTRTGLDILDVFNARIYVDEKQQELIEDFAEKKSITLEQSEFFFKMMFEFFEEYQQQDFKEILKDHPLYDPDFQMIERMYSHFFTSLYTYFDLYIMKIFQLIIPIIHGKELVDFQDVFKSKKEPKERLNVIATFFKIYNKNILNKEILNDRDWESTLDKVKEIRDTISHRNPIVSLDVLKEKFSKFIIQEKKKIQIEINKFDDEKYKIFIEMLKTSIEGLTISNTFLRIMKNCMAFLALFDNLIANEIKKRSN